MGWTRITDLSPLVGMPLERLHIPGTKVCDLRPLKGSALRFLYMSGTPVTDVEPLRGLPLYFINMTDSAVSDLTPLADLQLRQFLFTPRRIKKGIEAVRAMPTLRIIGVGFSRGTMWSPSEFWAKYDAGEFE